MKMVPLIKLPSGELLPALGQGTWNMGEDRRRRRAEITALNLGLDLGMRLIDTAEMYADGGAEKIVGAAIAGRRDEVFLVSKVLPEHATRRGTIAACERSLKRLDTDRIDLYLLHWREQEVELAEVLEAFTALVRAGNIRHWGVSNFDVEDMQELLRLPGGKAVTADQVMYNLNRRGIEHDLLPWCRRRRIPVMAYSPLDEGRLVRSLDLKRIAQQLGATPSQVALAWLLRQNNVIAIPKSASEAHVRENFAALDLRLGKQDLAALDHAFARPKRKLPLATT
ncbi:MAG: aldo/keto reductase [Alphaproteobacteria bacterium]|nr:MAG: aldo/keto reductase [Alphaproteobacteria bacterium]